LPLASGARRTMWVTLLEARAASTRLTVCCFMFSASGGMKTTLSTPSIAWNTTPTDRPLEALSY
jgi:hypothetical protein